MSMVAKPVFTPGPDPMTSSKLNTLATAAFGPFLSVSLGTGTTISASTPIPYSTVSEDTAAGWSTSTKRYVVQLDGLYLVVQTFKHGSTVPSGNEPVHAVRKNGTNVKVGPNKAPVAFGGDCIIHPVRCVQGDYIDAILNAGQASYVTQSDAGPENSLLIAYQQP